jgi:hypothetical protein
MTVGWRSMGFVLAALALLSGCGGSGGEAAPKAKASSTQPSSPPARPLDGLTPQQILDKSKAAAVAAGSVHVAGVSEGMTMDIRTTASGDGQGALSFGADGEVALLILDGQIYIRGDKRFWTVNADKSVAALLSGKWLKDDKREPQFGELAEILSLDQLLDEGLKPEGTMSIVRGRDVGGQATVGLLDTTADGGEGTLYVADADEPLPMLIISPQGEEITFSAWGEPVSVGAPRKDLVIDIGEL